MDDTCRDIRRIQIERYRALVPGRRLQIASELSRLADDFARAGLRQRHAGASPDELERRLLELKYGRDLVDAALSGRR